jgi:hypothetical protein
MGASPLDQTPPILASLRVAQRTKAHHERNKERGERTLREKQAWGPVWKEQGRTARHRESRLLSATTPRHSTPVGWSPPSAGTWTAPTTEMGGHQGTTRRSAAPGGGQGRWPPGLKWTPARGWGRNELCTGDKEQEPFFTKIQILVRLFARVLLKILIKIDERTLVSLHPYQVPSSQVSSDVQTCSSLLRTSSK